MLKSWIKEVSRSRFDHRMHAEFREQLASIFQLRVGAALIRIERRMVDGDRHALVTK